MLKFCYNWRKEEVGRMGASVGGTEVVRAVGGRSMGLCLRGRSD